MRKELDAAHDWVDASTPGQDRRLQGDIANARAVRAIGERHRKTLDIPAALFWCADEVSWHTPYGRELHREPTADRASVSFWDATDEPFHVLLWDEGRIVVRLDGDIRELGPWGPL